MKRNQRISILVKFLREHFPCKKKIIVRVGKTSKVKNLRVFGETQEKPYGFYIVINHNDNQYVQYDTLIHEWAHCLVPWNEKKDHSAKWGIQMAKIYTKVYNEF